MRQLLIFTLFLTFSGLVPIACVDQCGTGDPSDFVIQDLSLTAYDQDLNRLTEEDTLLRFRELKLMLSVTEFEEVISKATSFFVNSAQACSPAPSLAVNQLAALDVIANHPVIVAGDTLYAQDASLSDLFGAKLYGVSYHFDEILPYDFPNYRPITLEMISGFPTSTKLDFRVQVELEDEQVFVFDNLKFYIR